MSSIKKLKDKAEKILQIFRIYDEKGLISLTNITMMIVMYKIAMTPSLSFIEISGLALGVLGYQAKRVISK